MYLTSITEGEREMSSFGRCESRKHDDGIECVLPPSLEGEMPSVSTCEYRGSDDGIEPCLHSPATLGVKCHQSVHGRWTHDDGIECISPASMGVECRQSLRAYTEGLAMELKRMSPASLEGGCEMSSVG
jgi:hypothetical protein